MRSLHLCLSTVLSVAAASTLAAGTYPATKPRVERVSIDSPSAVVVNVARCRPQSTDACFTFPYGTGVTPTPGTDFRGGTTVCLGPSPRNDVPAFIFVNQFNGPIDVRMIPNNEQLPDATAAALCPRCTADNLARLQDLGLCDQPRPDSQRCETSLVNLIACDKPECNVVRTLCAQKKPSAPASPPPTTCTVDLLQIATQCDNGCSVTRHIDTTTAAGTIASYSIASVAATLPNMTIKSGDSSALFDASYFAGTDNKLTTKPLRFAVTLQGAALPTYLTFTPGSVTTGCVVPARKIVDQRAVLIPLDNTGVASWRYTNPRNPACLTCGVSGPLPLAFRNRTIDRAFRVTVEFPKEVSGDLARIGAFGCKTGATCKLTKVVQPQNAVVFDSALIATVKKTTPLKFQVSFFNEVDTPANPTAWVVLEQFTNESPLVEPESLLVTHGAASLSGLIDPTAPPPPDKLPATGYEPCRPLVDLTKYDKKLEPTLCANRPYDGKHAQHYAGSAKIDLAQNLGNRADALVSVVYKDGDLGKAGETNPLAASQYYVNLYGNNGLTLRFGETTYADSANNIAFREAGEGYRFAYQYFSLSHIIHRESATGVADAANKDDRVWIAQAKGVPFLQSDDLDESRTHNPLRMFRSFDLLYLRGADKASHTYTTAGGEAFYRVANINCGGDLTSCSFEPTPDLRRNYGTVAGSIAFYQSRRHLQRPPDCEANAVCADARGWAGLATATWSPTIRKSPLGGFEDG